MYQQVAPSTDPVPPTGIWENINHQLADLFSTYCHINSHQGSSLTRATCHFFSERAKCKSSLNLPAPGTRSFLPGQQISFFLPGYHAQLHDLKGFGKFWETLFTPKEWSLSKKGPKEGERVVARGQFHERVGETSVHWLTPGVGLTPIHCPISKNRPFEKLQRSNSIFK